ncbi:MAG: hypothetical protein LBD23_12500, partial [Oscillospiraceae bacterium]|nr:hypothetical protein [Oscillospiraceae bacterium]
MDKIKLDYSRQLIKEAANCLNTPLNNINSHIDCLEENTQVLLAHRLLMPIKSIKIGESVATSDGGSAKVQNCWKGNERELIEIRFDGASVRLTANHPVQTPNGFVKA